MSRCPKLDWKDTGFFSSGQYFCKLCNRDLSESEVNGKCKVDYGDKYKECPDYKRS